MSKCQDCGEPTDDNYLCSDCIEFDYIQNQDNTIFNNHNYSVYDYWGFDCEGDDYIDEDRPY